MFISKLDTWTFLDKQIHQTNMNMNNEHEHEHEQ